MRQAGPQGRPLPFVLLALGLLLACVAPAWAQKPGKKAPDKATLARQAEETFIDGMRADILGNTEKAIYYFEKALEDAPGSAAIRYKLAEMQARLGRYKDAQAYARQALDLEPGNRLYTRMLALLYQQNSEFAEAASLLSKTLKASPDQEELYPLLADIYQSMGKADDALKTLARAEKQLGPNPDLARRRQQLYLKLNKLDEALKEARRLMGMYPDEPEYVVNLAELLISNNRMAEAAKLLADNRAALDGQPGYDLLQLQIALKNGDTKAAKRYLLAALASPEMDLEDKLAYLGPYLRAASDTSEVPAMLDALQRAHRDQAKVYFIRGDFETDRGRYADSRAAYLTGLALDKNNFAVWEQVARLDMQLQQADSLVVHTNHALELFPNIAVLWFYNGWGYFLQKDNPKAIRSLERARKLKPADNDVEKELYALLGDLYNAQKQYDKSDEAYGAALKLDSLNTHVLNNYAYYLSLREQNLDLAARLGAKLMVLAPNEATFQDTYGWVLFKKGDYANALRYLEKAANPEASGVVWEHLGDALFKNGQTQRALEAWRQAQRKGGDVSPKLPEKINQGKYLE